MIKKITFKSKPVTLVGREVKIGDQGPDFRVVQPDLKEMSLASLEGKIKVITTFLSLDTPVCDLQVKEFNKQAAEFSKEVVVVGISKDLPFAQRRFCDSFGITNVLLASDYQFSSFGVNYGLLVKELNLLARAVLILDRSNNIRFLEIVDELTTPPHYDEALRSLKEVLKSPSSPLKVGLPSRCKPCEGGMPSLPKDKIEILLAQSRGWQLVEDKKITKEFRFKDFIEAKYFLDLVSVIAQDQGHHPALTLIYNKLKITLTTHAASGLTENDFIMAKMIDELTTGS